MCCNSITASTPQYFTDLLQIYMPCCTLWSTIDMRKLKIPLFKRKYSGQRSFSYQGPVTWNNLPFSIRHTQTYSSFKWQLKTHLFSQTFKQNPVFDALCIWFAIMRCFHGPCIAELMSGLHWLFRDVCMFACALLLALDHLVYMHVSCIDSDVHSCFELWSALSQSSWIRCYIYESYVLLLL